ncbi:MAG: sugar phosphate isomerase/epimerase family protein [Bryobacteraceae bacterium]
MKRKITRRGMMAALAAGAVMQGASKTPIRLGGPVFLNSDDPAALAREHRRLGYSAAYCPKVTVRETERIRAIEAAFRNENVAIAEVGAWVNMLDPDSEKRRKNLSYVAERLALADEIGARCCVNIAGSYNPEVWYGAHPDNLSPRFFEATVENCRRLIDEVKPKRTKFSIEMMGWSIPDSPDAYLDLLRAVDRKEFAVHIDVCNGVNSPERFYRNSDFIGECFRKLGRWIVSCHAKDLAWIPEMNIHFVEVIPGRGQIDYRRYLSELAALPVDAPLMLEHLKNAEEYDEGREYVVRIARELGLPFA